MILLAGSKVWGEYNITIRKVDNITLKITITMLQLIKRQVIELAESILREKSKEFAKDIISLCKQIKATQKESVLTNQILRSGTSIGANVHEGNYAQGKNDFISKFEIALKECYETEYWLELLYETNYITEQKYKELQQKCGQIRRMLISSCNTAKENK